jgi:outer membrane lipoprotein-sorting protein
MSIVSKFPVVRWTVPVAVAAIAVGGTALATQLTASAAAPLPARSAAQLLVDVETARVTALSGTVVEKADLGLPQLPTIGGAGSSDLSSLISGNHTLRVWYAGPSKARLALLGTLGESDVIRNGRDLWTWSSNGNSASHTVLPAESADQNAPTLGDLSGVTGTGLTPQQAADKALAAIDPTTTVTTDGSGQVAGRDAYELVLSSKDSASLVGQIRIAVDAVRHVPLRVQVYAAKATSPSIDIGFTQISFAQPPDSQFTFSPPPGVKVSESDSDSPSSAAPKGTAPKGTDPKGTDSAHPAGPIVSGQGWTSVVQAQLPGSVDSLAGKARSGNGTADSRSAGELSQAMGVLPRVSGTWGTGRLLKSKLVTVLLMDNGRVLAGPVSAERLYQLAGQPMPTTSTKP